MEKKKIKIGVSRCLLGEMVRYDGGHQHDRYITGTLGRFFEFVPVCPEVECGMPTPREALRLVGDPENPRLVTQKSGQDHTEQMRNWAGPVLDRLQRENIRGYIFKKNSPSSGLFKIKVYPENGGPPARNGRGIFAAMFTERFPLMPVEDDGRLNDEGLKVNFLTRVFVHDRWLDMLENGKRLRDLVEFHTRHKMTILAHNQAIYREMGKLVAHGKERGKERGMDGLFDEYLQLLMKALSYKQTIKKNVNVLMHMLGHFKTDLSADEKQEMLEIIDDYSGGDVPLIVPVTLFNHYVRKYGKDYLKSQYYLNPGPAELRLLNGM